MVAPPRRPRPRKSPKATWQTRSTVRRPVLVVGFGRMGGALAQGLDRTGWPVAVFPRSDASVKRAAELGFKLADLELMKFAALCILAVPDSAIRETAQALAADLGPHTVLIHCAGAMGLEAFGSEPAVLSRPRASFHPLVAVSSPEDPLEGHSVALSASTPTLLPTLRRMAQDLGLAPLEVPEDKRAAYHAGAVLAAGSLVSLLGAAIDAFAVAGIPQKDAQAALVPLARSALRGLEQRGPVLGLTGPVVRGDVDVVRRHLESLPLELREIYKGLAYRAFVLTQGSMNANVRAAFLDLLEPRR